MSAEYNFGGGGESPEAKKEKLLRSSFTVLLGAYRDMDMYAQTADTKRSLRDVFVAVHPDKHGGDPRFVEMAKLASNLYGLCDRPDGWRRQLVGHVKNTIDTLAKIYVTPPKKVEPPKPPVSAWSPPRYDAPPWGAGASASYEEPVDDEPESEAEWKSPYEVGHFDFDENLIGKRMKLVKIHLDEETIDRMFNDGDLNRYIGRTEPMHFFVIEGFDGVIVANNNHTDEYRSGFSGWQIIKGLTDFTVEKELGIIKSFSRYDREIEGSLGGYDKGTSVIVGNGSIRFGTQAYDAYYPNGYCDCKF